MSKIHVVEIPYMELVDDKDKQKAQEYTEKMEAEDQWDYLYFVREWEVK